ncbi:MAG: GNAT family N-acetyltransferase [Pseudomonadota bacterium]
MSVTELSIRTDRLHMRHALTSDAAFFCQLMNDPDWLAFIGDRNIHDERAAADYIVNHTQAAYERRGIGMCVVTLDDVPIGLCGLNLRQHLTQVDLGFAFLPDYRRNGYAFEAASASILHARNTLGLQELIAITLPENTISQRLLTRLGFRFARLLEPNEQGEVLALYQQTL